MLKGRLSVLQIEEEKSDFRAFLNDHRYQFHQQMRDEMRGQRHGYGGGNPYGGNPYGGGQGGRR